MPTGSSFRIFSGSFPGGRAITELWSATTRTHAYAASGSEVAALRAVGFRELGTLGHVATAAPDWGEPVRVRHFRRGQGDDALTADPEQAEALLASGFQELEPLGYGLTDYGELRKPQRVVRFRDPTSGHVVHTASSLSEELAGFSTEGEQFALLPQPLGCTLSTSRSVPARSSFLVTRILAPWRRVRRRVSSCVLRTRFSIRRSSSSGSISANG